MRALIILAASLAMFASCKKEYSCECKYTDRTCTQKRDAAGFITTVNCKDSLTNNSFEYIGKLIKQKAVNKCHNYQRTKTFHDTTVIYEIIECDVR